MLVRLCPPGKILKAQLAFRAKTGSISTCAIFGLIMTLTTICEALWTARIVRHLRMGCIRHQRLFVWGCRRKGALSGDVGFHRLKVVSNLMCQWVEQMSRREPAK